MRSWSEERVRWELASTFNIAPAEMICHQSWCLCVGGDTQCHMDGEGGGVYKLSLMREGLRTCAVSKGR